MWELCVRQRRPVGGQEMSGIDEADGLCHSEALTAIIQKYNCGINAHTMTHTETEYAVTKPGGVSLGVRAS